MKKHFISLTAAVAIIGGGAVMMGAATPVFAGATPSNLTLSAGYIGNYTHYKEHLNGTVPDRESGWANGVFVKGQKVFATRHKLGRVFINAGMSYQYGKFNYDGHTMNNNIPLNAKTDEYIFNAAVKSGFIQTISPQFEVREYGILGYHNWERKLQKTALTVGTAENYHWLYTGLGAGTDYLPNNKLDIGFRIEGMVSPIKSTVLRGQTSNYPGKLFGYKDLYSKEKLGVIYGWHAALPVSYKITKKIAVGIVPFYTYWHIKHSDTSQVMFVEPSSKTKEIGVTSGITYSF